MIDAQAMRMSHADRKLLDELTEEAAAKFSNREAALKYFLIQVRSRYPAIWATLQRYAISPWSETGIAGLGAAELHTSKP
jgi:ribosomal protein S12 methylthiotransferase accessory factor YcaO